MKRFFHNRSLYIASAAVVIAGVILMLLGVGRSAPPVQITSAVEKGSVRQLVSVSGVATAKQTADLAFTVTGAVQTVSAQVGDVVEAGTVLISLDTRALLSDRSNAYAELTRAIANKNELVAGPQAESRTVTSETVKLKRDTLKTVEENEANKVRNAKRTLLSADLAAYSDDPSEEAVLPLISGTYLCEKEGAYTLKVYSSGSNSGYSYQLSGIETGVFPASTDQAISMGECGLRVQFDPDSNYGNTTWYVEIPNTKSASYPTNLNAYNLAVTQAASAISLAKQELTLAEATEQDSNAPARSEEIIRADASIQQAQARLERIDSEIADRTLKAPFTGTITEVNIAAGETVTTAPVMILVADADFEVTARIPEIDIGKLLVGQKVSMVFDARSQETLTGTVSFISLKATEIDGVSYYEAYIQPDSTPPWVRSGLNADIDIIISETTDTLRIPKRFLITEHDSYFVLKQIGEGTATTSVAVTLQGNDGFVAITGLNEGDIVVAP